MLLFFKSLSKTVDESILLNPQDTQNKDSSHTTSLTVWRKSLLFNCKGFTVIGSDGNLVYRVDCYDGRPSQVILMDESGHPLLTLLRRKKKLGLVDNWFIFEGEEEIEDLSSNSSQAKKAIYVFRRNKIILAANMNVLAHVYRGMNEKRYAYVIEGSYANRSCRIVDSESKRVVAEVKKKEAMKGEGHVSCFGSEVFLLIVNNGFDSKFAMAFILLLDQMFS